MESLSESLFDELCDIHFKGAFFTVQKALPWLRDGASVILVSAFDADKQGRMGTSVYTAAKSAVRSLAQSARGGGHPRPRGQSDRDRRHRGARLGIGAGSGSFEAAFLIR